MRRRTRKSCVSNLISPNCQLSQAAALEYRPQSRRLVNQVFPNKKRIGGVTGRSSFGKAGVAGKLWLTENRFLYSCGFSWWICVGHDWDRVPPLQSYWWACWLFERWLTFDIDARGGVLRMISNACCFRNGGDVALVFGCSTLAVWFRLVVFVKFGLARRCTIRITWQSFTFLPQERKRLLQFIQERGAGGPNLVLGSIFEERTIFRTSAFLRGLNLRIKTWRCGQGWEIIRPDNRHRSASLRRHGRDASCRRQGVSHMRRAWQVTIHWPVLRWQR